METLSKNKIKWIRSFRMKKNRDRERIFVVEGTKIVQEILREWPEAIVCIVTSNATMDPIDWKGEAYLTDEPTMKSLSGLSTASNILAVVNQPTRSLELKNWTIALDGIQDPGNMGTIIRTADWFGIENIVCSKETVDCYNPKVVQATMGSILRVTVHYTSLSEFLQESNVPVYGALLEGQNIHDLSSSEEGIILLGNEGNGISENLFSQISHPVHIPGRGGAESLNVAIAGGIFMGILVK